MDNSKHPEMQVDVYQRQIHNSVISKISLEKENMADHITALIKRNEQVLFRKNRLDRKNYTCTTML